MGKLNIDLTSSESGAKVDFWAGRIFTFVFGIPFAGMGLFVIWKMVEKFQQGKMQEALPGCLFGLVFVAVGFGLMFASVTAARRKRAAEASWLAQTDGGKKLWLARPDWAAGRIKSLISSQVKVQAFMALAFCVMGGLLTIFVLPKELHKGNNNALVILIFPAIGIGVLVVVIRAMLAKHRFGDCSFELAQIPAPLGGTLDGLIQTGAPLKLEQGLHLKLSCIQRTVSGSGNNRSVQENIFWQNEKVFRRDAGLPATGAGGSGIPVHFQLPSDQPESSLRGAATIIWRLDARAKMSGPDFAATFEVPVFRVAGTVSSAETDSDPTAPLQMSAEEIRRDEHSKIRVSDGPAGREFYFPAARNLGTAFMLTLFLVIWSGFLWMMIRFHAPILFPIVFGLFEVLIFWGCLQTWFKSSRVTVNSSGVTLQNRWLFFTRIRRFDSGEIVRFDTKVGMTSGTKAFHDLKLVTRASEDNFAARKARYQQTGERPPLKFEVKDPAGVTLAGGLASKPEADWLVKAMNESLGR